MKRNIITLILMVFFIPVFLISAGGKTEITEGFSVVDSLGNEANLNGVPERIAVAGKATLITADALYLFPEAHGRVIGLGKTNQGLGDFFPLLDPLLDEKKRLAHEIGPEQIAALKPDLLIVKDFVYRQLGEPVAKLGIPVIALSLETPEQYRSDIRIIGSILGNEERAEEIVEYYDASLERVRARVSSIPDSQRPSVLMLYYTNRGGETAFNVPPAGWIQTAQVEEAGGRAVWKDTHQGGGWKTVNFEQIASWNPDYIIITSYNSDADSYLPGILSDSRWQQLKAGQSGTVLPVPSDFHSWAQPDTRWILAVSWLAKELYPERFGDMDMRGEVVRFYTELYGVSEDLVNSMVLPRLEGELSD
jgi:iron complex transport system substrate-binding protein